MKQDNIKQLENLIQEKYGNTAGIIVQKNNKVLYEQYFNGSNANHHFHVFSITKSVFATLVGIAVDQGLIKSIDELVLSFFPEYKVLDGEEGIKTITIKDLLTMSAPYKYEVEPYEQFFMSKNWIHAALDLLGGDKPKGSFHYAAIIGTHILSGILMKATNTSVFDYATEYLFNPLGIEVKENIILHNAQEQFAFYEADNISGWVADEQGINPAGWGLTLTTQDLIKIGQLYLNEGMWEGKCILSKEWIHESTKEHSRWLALDLPYGYLWWVLDHGFAAMGDGGNVLYVNVKEQLIIAITASFIPDANDRLDLIKQHIEPIFID